MTNFRQYQSDWGYSPSGFSYSDITIYNAGEIESEIHSSLCYINDFAVIIVDNEPLNEPTNPQWDRVKKYIYIAGYIIDNGKTNRPRKCCSPIRRHWSDRNSRSNWNLRRIGEGNLRAQSNQIIHTTYDRRWLEEKEPSSIICIHQQHLKKVGRRRNTRFTEGWPIQILQMEPTLGGLLIVSKLLMSPLLSFQLTLSALYMFYLMLADLEKYFILGAMYV